MRILVWLFRAAVFFALFAFALNNQHETTVRWFFGIEWRAPMVFVVLAAFAIGAAVGVVAMMPSWWRHRRSAHRRSGAAAADSIQTLAPASELPSIQPPRDGI
jgi:uncharacterized integral membrane protein